MGRNKSELKGLESVGIGCFCLLVYLFEFWEIMGKFPADETFAVGHEGSKGGNFVASLVTEGTTDTNALRQKCVACDLGG